MIILLGTIAKIFALIGLGSAVIFALSDSVTAATIAAIGTVAASAIGLINTFFLGKVYNVAQENRTNVKEVKGVVDRRNREHPPPDGSYKREKDNAS